MPPTEVSVVIAKKKAAQEQLIQRIKEAEAAKESGRLLAEQQAFAAIKGAEAARQAAELHAQELITLSAARQEAAAKDAESEKLTAEGRAAQAAAEGLGATRVQLAQAEASQKQGRVDAEIIALKAGADAEGITKKAAAMKLLEEAGRQHEEFKLNLDKAKEVELAGIHVQRDIAEQQAAVLGEALKSAKIEIVGGETTFFDKITQAIGNGRAVDRMVENSRTLSDVRDTFFNGDPEYFKGQMRQMADQFGLTSEDAKNLTLSALLMKMLSLNPDDSTRGRLQGLLGALPRFGLADEAASTILGGGKRK